MSKVYQHQLHAHKTHRPHPWRWTFLVVFVLAGASWFVLSHLKSDTTITAAKPVTKKVTVNDAKVSFQKGAFIVDMPRGWQFMGIQKDIYTIYHFRGSGAEDGGRSIAIYEDSSLPNFAVNRMIPVTAAEDGSLVTDASQVSDNCSAYTNASPGTSTSSVGRPAKWQGIDFLCDMSNTLRNVVGTGSKDGINTVNVKTPTSRPHHYFFTYTDNNIKPDYNPFALAINSFKVVE